MKKIFTKNGLIGVLLFTNMAMGGFFVYEKADLKSVLARRSAAHAQGSGPGTRKPAERQVAAVGGGLGDHSRPDSAVQVCYEKFLASEPEVDEGQVTFHWTINEEGKIDFLELKQSDFGDPSFTDCIAHKVKEARFQGRKTPEGMIVSHKFKFRRKDLARASFEEL